MDANPEISGYPASVDECFCEEGFEFQLAREGNGSGGPGAFAIKLTKDQFVAFIGGVHSKYEGTQHMSCNTSIKFTGPDSAFVKTYCHNYHLKKPDHRADGDFFVFVGVYDDDWIKTDKGWRIKNPTLWPLF